MQSKSKRKPGGQRGHPGQTLKIVDNPDHILWHKIDKKCDCGYRLKEQSAQTYRRRQVFDIPPVKVEVTEHRAEVKTCPQCGRIHKAPFPQEVAAPVQYGSTLKAIAIYLRGYQLLPSQRTAELFEDVFSCPISEGALDSILKEGSAHVEEPVERIKQQLKASSIVCFDETGMSQNGDTYWLHSASTEELTYYSIHQKRGREAMNAIGILPEFEGMAIHDSLSAYFTYGQCRHGLCNAHHIRELTFIKEISNQVWAGEMIECLLKMKRKTEKAREASQGQLSQRQIKYFERLYQSIVEKGYKANPLQRDPPLGRSKRGRPKKGKARCLVERFDIHRQKVLAFLYDLNVPFDNNLAERDIRMAKLKQKISGTFRSEEMAHGFCRIRSFISTVRKQSRKVMESIRTLLSGSPFIPVSG
ncbi:MAG: Mobile element protein [Candidatus Jettenia ecosi]|uniref:Mobile element protein n=1 Tax=Candidatus Jettenia ecosi TaxID=2494326 RepID=A0A533Q6V3_9BACT|nr:MAG: Mobile element protein [Candidatus Jettenia ecosi]